MSIPVCIVCEVEVEIPNEEELQQIQFDNEDIKIVEQPIWIRKEVRCAVGDKITLKCSAVCKHKLTFEWLKR